MQLWLFGAIVGVVFGLVWYEFNRVAAHVNGLKDDYRRLADEQKELRERVRLLEKRKD
jgi:hypothetical protein